MGSGVREREGGVMVRNEREREKYSERERQRSYGKKVDKFLLVKLRGYISRKRL